MNSRVSKVRKAVLDPSSVYVSPAELAADDTLNRSEKFALLALWEADARELAVAEEENMGGGEPSRLDEILECLNGLGDTEGHAPSAANKQAVSMPDLGRIRVRHFLRPPPDTIHPDLGRAEAWRRMDDQHLQLLVVTDGTEIVGTLTPGDLESTAAEQLPTRNLMDAHLAFCFGDDEIATALCVMDRKASDHLLVIEPDGMLIGVLCRQDLPTLIGQSAPHADEPGRKHLSGAVASTIQPGGLQVYPEQPKIRIRARRVEDQRSN